MAHINQRRIVQVVSDVISDEEARNLVVKARIITAGILAAYQKNQHNHWGVIQIIFTLEVDESWNNKDKDSDELLAYARDHMPDNLVFGKW